MQKLFRESWFIYLLKVLLYTLLTSFTLMDFSSSSGVAIGTCAALLAASLCPWLLRLPLREYLWYVFAIFLILFAFAVESFVLNSNIFSQSLGITGSLKFSEMLFLSLSVFGFLFLIRSLSLFHLSFNLLEAVLAISFFIWKLAPHRDFALHRPRYISDLSWDMGMNPVIILLLIGSVLLMGAATLMIKSKRFWRANAQFLLIIMVALSVFFYFKDKNINFMPRDNPFGLNASDNDKNRGSKGGQGQNNQGGNQGDKNGNQQQGGKEGGNQQSQGGQNNQNQQGGGSKNDPNEMPFKNDYSQPNNLPVALIQFDADYNSPIGSYYFRQTAFSQFNGHRLVQNVLDSDLFIALPSEGFVKIQQAYQNYPNYYFKLDTKVFFLVDPTKPYGLANPVQMQRIQNPNPTFFSGAYQVQSWAPNENFDELMKNNLSVPNWPDYKIKAYLELPNDPRYQQLSNEIVKSLKPAYQDLPLAKMMAIVYYLGKNGKYSLSSDHADAKDPTASFLFGNKTGYCVHFAHAAVYLARSLGIPARVGAGYAVPTKRREKGENLAIMDQDAHAWPEIYLEPYGWLIIDVPIQNYLDPPMQEPSSSLQNTLGQIAKTGKNQTAEEKQEQEEKKKQFEEKINQVKQWLIAIGKVLAVLMGILLLSLYFYKMWRLWAWSLGNANKLSKRAYRSVLDRLHYLGIRRNYGESREDFANRIQSTVPSFTLLTNNLLDVELGKHPACDLNQMNNFVTNCKKEIKNHRVLWKMILVIVNPLAWLRSK